jgi:hypothetical protein
MEQRGVSDWRMGPVLVGRGRERARVGEGGEGYLSQPRQIGSGGGIEGIHSITEGG